MSPNASDPRLVGSAGVAEINVQQDGRAGSADGSASVVTPVTIDRPCPGRSMWQHRVVDSRGHVHLHRCGPPRKDGYLRTAPCGDVYVIAGGTA